MNDFLNIQNFSCGYKNSFTLKEIDFKVAKGAFAGIIGPNGSGKTTLFKGITGELKKQRGEVCFHGESLTSMSLKEKALNIAVVSQFTDTGDMTVEEFVLMGRIPYRNRWQFFETRQDMRIAEEYMKLTDVFPMRRKPMTRLSGGEQQLAAIARALTQEPKLLLLDEPTSHLDISHQVQILNLIQKLTTDLKLTVLMVIHDLNLASEYCDYLVMMQNGGIFTKGKPDHVITYKNIEEVYKTVVITQPNPLSKKPSVFLVSNKILTSNIITEK